MGCAANAARDLSIGRRDWRASHRRQREAERQGEDGRRRAEPQTLRNAAPDMRPDGFGCPWKSEYVHRRSEEHTSELQSLMRISYAVFCLKKKKQQKQQLYY